MSANLTGKTQYCNLPNCITVLRMAGTLCLLFLRPLSTGFFVFYTLSGLTDVLDGWLARRTGTASCFGAKLDSIADLLFYTVVLVRIVPFLWLSLPREVWYAVGVVLILRLSAYLATAVRSRRFASLHTWLNKLTGAAVFLIPYVLFLPLAPLFCFAVCGIAAVAALEELLIHLCEKEYHPDTKGLWAELRRHSR